MAEDAPLKPGEAFEARLPEGQRWINRFCENWIFAFLIAMAIRHYLVEAFTIPTASMEPMLYGEKGFLQGDHVVVDKLVCRFRSPKRWDVTVFQFPEPEIEYQDSGRTAIDADNEPINSWPLQPLMYRNFVKRLVGLPGDVFYIANGEYHLRQPDGTFVIPKKPAAIQEALWQEIFRAGAQPSYQPWAPALAVQSKDQDLIITSSSAAPVAFTQPFRNLYIKPGSAGVQRLPEGEMDYVDVSMVTPQFTYPADQSLGSIWDLDQWSVRRRTLEDVDNDAYGTDLSRVDREWVGDVRLQATITILTGHPTLVLRHGTQQGIQLTLGVDGWRLDGLDGLAKAAPYAQGPDSLLGHQVTLTHLDDECIFARDGAELVRFTVPEVDPNLQRTLIQIGGNGVLGLGGLHVQRSLHYAANWLLMDETLDKAQKQSTLSSPATDEIARNKTAADIRDIARVRRQCGAPDGYTGPWGDSPAHAVTIPAGCYLMLGDNSPTSWDGRAWGFVPAENLRGRAIAVVLPFSRWRIVR